MNRDSFPSPHVRSVALDLILTVLTCGLWNMMVQYEQGKALNQLLKREKYFFWKLYLFSFLTCGIYYFYHQYIKADDFQRATEQDDSSDAILLLILSLFGLGLISDAILQHKINLHFENLGRHKPL